MSLMRLRQGQWLPAMTHMEQSLAVKPKRGLFGSLFLILIRFALGLFGGNNEKLPNRFAAMGITQILPAFPASAPPDSNQKRKKYVINWRRRPRF
ncbi:MAG: hypothetical protein M5U34_41885 [Chloroflexi bacterium]|nr:hypothetical protein [Chloroflexota bacterium]